MRNRVAAERLLGMKRNSPDSERVTLSIRDVTGEARYLFNAICGASPGYGKSRGQVFSELIRAKADEVFGEGHAEYMVQSYQEQVRNRSNE